MTDQWITDEKLPPAPDTWRTNRRYYGADVPRSTGPHPDPLADSPWLQTLSADGEYGGRLDLTNPRPEQISLRHIATVLSRIPRFGGHTSQGPYSVAQHCLVGAEAMRRDHHSLLAQVAFLLHDAHEAYVGDWATPVQRALWAIAREDVGDVFASAAEQVVRIGMRSLKERLDQAIYTAAGLPWPLPESIGHLVHTYDLRMCRTERDARMAPPPCAWDPAIENAEPVVGCDLNPWSAGTAEKLYWQFVVDYLPLRR